MGDCFQGRGVLNFRADNLQCILVEVRNRQNFTPSSIIYTVFQTSLRLFKVYFQTNLNHFYQLKQIVENKFRSSHTTLESIGYYQRSHKISLSLEIYFLHFPWEIVLSVF